MEIFDSRGRGGRIAAIPVVCIALVCSLMAPGRARSESAQPYFLVATPNLSDPLFQESVVLMLPVTQPPLVAGFIINKPTTIPLRKLFPDAPAVKNRAENAYFGGPVDLDRAWLLLRAAQAPPDATRLLDDIYLSDDPHSMGETLKDPHSANDLHVLLGRAQWSQNQLHGEMFEGSWYTMPAEAEMVFAADPRRIWRILSDRAQLQEVDAIGARAPDAFRLLTVRFRQGGF